MKPIIGVTSSVKDERTMLVSYDNIDSVTASGGVPLVLPNLTNEEEIEQISNRIDGLLVTGGGDIDPTLFGEEPHPNLGLITPGRDTFEISLIKKMIKARKPVLAICRGCQVLNIAGGGDMYQDIYSQTDRQLLQHRQVAPRSHGSHYIDVQEGSLLNQITGSDYYKVNSFHHQAVRDMAPGFFVSARSSDGIIEALESREHPFLLGVQWHPECMTALGDKPSLLLFSAFIEASKEKAKQQQSPV